MGIDRWLQERRKTVMGPQTDARYLKPPEPRERLLVVLLSKMQIFPNRPSTREYLSRQVVIRANCITLGLNSVPWETWCRT